MPVGIGKVSDVIDDEHIQYDDFGRIIRELDIKAECGVILSREPLNPRPLIEAGCCPASTVMAVP